RGEGGGWGARRQGDAPASPTERRGRRDGAPGWPSLLASSVAFTRTRRCTARMTLDDTLAMLHPAQRAAVTHPARPLLLACGPGSGKTRILTHRIQRLIEHEDFAATEILALTFSRAAADELRGRLARALGPLARGLWAGTFHGFGAWLLRRHAAPLGRTAAFTILDREDTRRLI